MNKDKKKVGGQKKEVTASSTLHVRCYPEFKKELKLFAKEQKLSQRELLEKAFYYYRDSCRSGANLKRKGKQNV